MKVITVDMTDLKILKDNVRNHTPTQIKELARSYQMFGQTRPVVIDENNTILIGNGFYMALQSLGVTKIDAYRITGLTEIQKKKLVLSDNKTFSIGLDDFDNITNYINEIVASGDLDIAGYDESVLKEMTRTLEEITSDMDSQGMISQEQIEEMNRAQDRIETATQPVPQQASQSAQSSLPTNQFNQSSGSVNPPEIIEEPTVVAKPNVEKTIICPNCGEVIHLA